MHRHSRHAGVSNELTRRISRVAFGITFHSHASTFETLAETLRPRVQFSRKTIVDVSGAEHAIPTVHGPNPANLDDDRHPAWLRRRRHRFRDVGAV